MNARCVFTPSTQAVHWLGTALSGALLVGVDIWASKTIVSSIGADGVGSAALVLVLIAVMETGAIGTPVSCTVHWLTATVGSTLNQSISMRTLGSTQVSLSGDLVCSATLILVAICNMVTATIQAPFAFAVHRLAAATLGAL